MGSLVAGFLIFCSLLSFNTLSCFAEEKQVRLYTHTPFDLDQCPNIVLQGNISEIANFQRWLNEIKQVPIGKETLEGILKSDHNLTISHDRSSRVSAGRTLAPMSENLINGVGTNVEIFFDASIPESGSHMVYNALKVLVEYTATQNLFHELVHAKHKMKGTWRYFDSEGQAIEEENIFRKQATIINGKLPTERVWKTGVLIESLKSSPSRELAGSL